MGEKGSEVQLLGFINAVLGRTGDDQFTSVEILENKSFTPKVIGDKASILDVRAVLKGNTRVNVEVQLSNQHNLEKRSLYYWSREFADSLDAGQDYRELPDVIAINIVNFDFPPVSDFHTCFHLREDRHQDFTLTSALEIHYLNMVQYRKQVRDLITCEWSDPLCRWLAWLNVSSPPELLAEVVEMDAAIMSAEERMVYVTGDKEAIRAYEMRLMALSDQISAENYAREKGHAEGHEQGLEQGHAEGREQGREQGREESREAIARNALAEGLSVNLVQKITGLDIKTIERLASAK